MILINDMVRVVLIEIFKPDFMLRALIGGGLVAVICALAGTWVVIRGMSFLGEAIGHGILPGVAFAGLLGVPPMLGAAASAAVMSGVLGALQRRGRIGSDSAIGLVFVAMLSFGIIIVSHSRSFATDATGMLFGDVLGIAWVDILILLGALVVTIALAVAAHRSFVAAAFDPRLAATLGFRPERGQALLVALVCLAVIASFQAVGTLLVVGLLLAPSIAAKPWTQRIPGVMTLAALEGVLAVVLGLLASWCWGTAAGPSICCAAIALAGISHAAHGFWAWNRRRKTADSAMHYKLAEGAS